MSAKALPRQEKITRSPQPQAAAEQPGESEIENALADFQVIRSLWLQRVFTALPLAVLIATLVYLFSFWAWLRMIRLDFATVGITVIVSVLVTRDLFDMFPQTLLIVWRRRLLTPHGASGDAASPEAASDHLRPLFKQFIEDSEQQINSQFSLVFGACVALIVLWLFWPLRALTAEQWMGRFQTDAIPTIISVILRMIYYAGAFFGGAIIWRAITIARRVYALGVDFDFNVQVEHPDGCGGLRPLGDLCLRLAFTLAPLLLLVSGWLAAINLVAPERLSLYADITANLPVLLPTVQMLTVVLVVLSLLGFFQPLTSIHAGMSRARVRLLQELDLISQQIHEIGVELRTRAEALSSDQGATLEQKMDFLRRVYERNSKIPTWPINVDHLWRLLTIQVAPAIGIATSGLGLASNLMNLFR